MIDVAANHGLPRWALGPFSDPQRVLEDRAMVEFTCPLSSGPVAWAAKDAFNPGAVVHDGRICLLVRGEDRARHQQPRRIEMTICPPVWR